MPRVLPSPTVTPHHSPDRFNFPRLFTSPSTSPPWSPVAERQSFDLSEEEGVQADQVHANRWRSHPEARRRRHSHGFDAQLSAMESRPLVGRHLRRQPSEPATVPCGRGGVRTSKTWTEQQRYRLPETVKQENANEEEDSESDGEGWC